MLKVFILLVTLFILNIACTPQKNETNVDASAKMGQLTISDNGRFFLCDGEPFFWLGDTGWLLFSKLDRQQAAHYLDNRSEKGFNVIQVMTLHAVAAVNVYGDSALVKGNVATPNSTEGNNFDDADQYDFWDHVDYIVDLAAEKGLYIALVPVWGSNVKAGYVDQEQARTYAAWLADRYKDRPNIIWLNGGDIHGDDSLQVWQTIGKTLGQHDPDHLITFHPRGRTQSSMWFHNASWLDFNMFQSGHRRYDQDTTALAYGQDNWRYVQTDYQEQPVKPTIDGEPSYEGIPQGLHDPEEPYWDADDVRRYGYWSVFAGAGGFTYGHNAVMQMHCETDTDKAFGVRDTWTEALDHPGAQHMQYLKNLMLSRPYLERVPDQSLVKGDEGERYYRLLATRGAHYAFIYNYTGRNMSVHTSVLPDEEIKASWYNPRNGELMEIETFANQEQKTFDPPGEPEEGNDWVLVLEGI